jgi:dTDP-4-dehydrorhamnose 3,5-epimerase
MEVIHTPLEGLLIIEPTVFEDHRGFFLETYRQISFKKLGMDRRFVQDNLSFSIKDTLRGLHFQVKHPQAKLVQTVTGEIFDVAADIRTGSATFGQWSGVNLSEKNKRQLYIPEGFAHGFCVLSETAHVIYKCSDYYYPDDESGILWSDPAIGVDWPIENPIISAKDAKLPLLSHLPSEKRFDPVEKP